MDDLSLRRHVIETALRMNSTGLSKGTSGNVSARVKGGFVITPSGMRYEDLQTDDIVKVDMNGRPLGRRHPSSEWRFHMDIYAERPDLKAIVHTHSTFSTVLACLQREIPAFHYMVAVAGGHTIRCAPYALFGTQELSDLAIKALTGRNACLLGNHGLIAGGESLRKAFSLAGEVEELAKQYWHVCQMGEPRILDDEEMEDVIRKFQTYGDKAQDMMVVAESKPLPLPSRPKIGFPKRSR